ncbi:hypothetical protein SISSUDRAFT_435373 [Sistotremastrum suecicum HHB10207 ss-3]|uniref:Uncharacterized protein n=1 Tax=Sistotremastrum suecicum HHB10207 ss-3 TaxID=1314776 RepID=A0A165YF18_9AGAM|nr:hypothetical protein SISSUDRAFT_435373 [Sistotremastrum suecicum HHB10207 ss-3]
MAHQAGTPSRRSATPLSLIEKWTDLDATPLLENQSQLPLEILKYFYQISVSSGSAADLAVALRWLQILSQSTLHLEMATEIRRHIALKVKNTSNSASQSDRLLFDDFLASHSLVLLDDLKDVRQQDQESAVQTLFDFVFAGFKGPNASLGKFLERKVVPALLQLPYDRWPCLFPAAIECLLDRSLDKSSNSTTICAGIHAVSQLIFGAMMQASVRLDLSKTCLDLAVARLSSDPTAVIPLTIFLTDITSEVQNIHKSGICELCYLFSDLINTLPQKMVAAGWDLSTAPLARFGRDSLHLYSWEHEAAFPALLQFAELTRDSFSLCVQCNLSTIADAQDLHQINGKEARALRQWVRRSEIPRQFYSAFSEEELRTEVLGTSYDAFHEKMRWVSFGSHWHRDESDLVDDNPLDFVESGSNFELPHANQGSDLHQEFSSSIVDAEMNSAPPSPAPHPAPASPSHISPSPTLPSPISSASILIPSVPSPQAEEVESATPEHTPASDFKSAPSRSSVAEAEVQPLEPEVSARVETYMDPSSSPVTASSTAEDESPLDIATVTKAPSEPADEETRKGEAEGLSEGSSHGMATEELGGGDVEEVEEIDEGKSQDVAMDVVEATKTPSTRNDKRILSLSPSDHALAEENKKPRIMSLSPASKSVIERPPSPPPAPPAPPPPPPASKPAAGSSHILFVRSPVKAIPPSYSENPEYFEPIPPAGGLARSPIEHRIPAPVFAPLSSPVTPPVAAPTSSPISPLPPSPRPSKGKGKARLRVQAVNIDDFGALSGESSPPREWVGQTPGGIKDKRPLPALTPRGPRVDPFGYDVDHSVHLTEDESAYEEQCSPTRASVHTPHPIAQSRFNHYQAKIGVPNVALQRPMPVRSFTDPIQNSPRSPSPVPSGEPTAPAQDADAPRRPVSSTASRPAGQSFSATMESALPQPRQPHASHNDKVIEGATATAKAEKPEVTQPERPKQSQRTVSAASQRSLASTGSGTSGGASSLAGTSTSRRLRDRPGKKTEAERKKELEAGWGRNSNARR